MVMLLGGTIRNLLNSFRARSFTTKMQSAALNSASSRRYHRRPVKRSQVAGLDQDVVTDRGRQQMTNTVSAVASSAQNINIVQEPAESLQTAHKQGRHFTNKKFSDASISSASKNGITHE